MKKAIVLLVIGVFAIGCNSYLPKWGANQITYPQSVCEEKRPEQFIGENSWICEASKEANIAPEEIDNFLLDTTTTLFLFDVLTRERVGDLIGKTRERTSNNCSGLTYTEMLDGIYEDALKLQLSLSLLNRRLGIYYSNKPITNFDCWLVNKAVDHQAELFGF